MELLKKGIPLTLIVLLLAACTSIVQKTGEVLEGTAFSEMDLSLYRSAGKPGRNAAVIELRELRNADGKFALEISSSAWPGFLLRGGMPGGNGKIALYEARILSSHTKGWNDVTLEIMGEAFFEDPRKQGGILYIPGEIKRVQISSGKIRLKSNRFTGNSALASLRNRRERILALTEWMDGRQETNHNQPVFTVQKDFENFWKPLLFPELVSRKKRPGEFSASKAEWVKEDSIRWNRTYTETVFPEELWEYRNSGAMLRDWEEAVSWIFIEYSWDYVIGTFNDIGLNKIK